MTGEYISTGNSFGAGSSLLLPGSFQTTKLEMLKSQLGRPWPLAYGRHIVGGNVMFQQALPYPDEGTTVSFVALGEGEWDGIEELWIDGLLRILPDETIHFHPGTDGELGHETDPTVRNQKICSFYPIEFTPELTFTRLAYLGLRLPPDPQAPNVALDVRGIYRTRKVRIFDEDGNQTAFEYSANPAWCMLDLLILRSIKPYGLVNEALTSDEKARIDFPAFVDLADYCDEADPVDGLARYECHVAFVDPTDLQRAFDLMMLTCRGYILDRGGKLAVYTDQSRSGQYVADRDSILEGSLSYSRKDTRNLANRVTIQFRDLNSGDGTGEGGADDPANDFQTIKADFDNPNHQDQVGRIVKTEIDIGNSIWRRAAQIGEYLRDRSLLLTDQVKATLIIGAKNPIDLLPGDVLTAPTDIDAFLGIDYEVLEITDEPDGSRQLFAQQYSADFTTPAGAPRLIFPTDPGSTSAGGTIRDSELPGAPVDLELVTRGATFIASWLDPTSGNKTLDNICLQYSKVSDFSAAWPDTCTVPNLGKINYQESPPRPGETWYFRVASHNKSGVASNATVKAAIETVYGTGSADTGWGPFCIAVGPITSGVLASVGCLALTDAETIDTDASLGNMFVVTIAGNRTLAPVTNAYCGQPLVWRVTQGSGGGHILALDEDGFAIGPDVPAFIWSTAEGATDYFGGMFNVTTGKVDVLTPLMRGY